MDSLETLLSGNKKARKNKTITNQWQTLSAKSHFPYRLITDLNSSDMTCQLYTGINNYEFHYVKTQLKWNLIAQDSTICGYNVKKATTTYAGREYEAWYTEDVVLPYGPYIFSGLPGLIVKISDVRCNWIFTLNGVKEHDNFSLMYLLKQGFISGEIINTTRQNALDAYKNEIENYDNLAIDIFNVKVKKDGQWVTPEANKPLRPSNMLELRW